MLAGGGCGARLPGDADCIGNRAPVASVAGAAKAAAATPGVNGPSSTDSVHPHPTQTFRRPSCSRRGFPRRLQQFQNRQERSHCGHHGHHQRRRRWLRYRPTISSAESPPLFFPSYQAWFHCGFLIQASDSSRRLRYAPYVWRGYARR